MPAPLWLWGAGIKRHVIGAIFSFSRSTTPVNRSIFSCGISSGISLDLSECIFSLIDREKIGGAILLSADRHHTDVYKINRPNGYDLYEFETSKLTNIHTHETKKEALFSYNEGSFFGMLCEQEEGEL